MDRPIVQALTLRALECEVEQEQLERLRGGGISDMSIGT